jgi:hypothetical protein
MLDFVLLVALFALLGVAFWYVAESVRRKKGKR